MLGSNMRVAQAQARDGESLAVDDDDDYYETLKEDLVKLAAAVMDEDTERGNLASVALDNLDGGTADRLEALFYGPASDLGINTPQRRRRSSGRRAKRRA